MRGCRLPCTGHQPQPNLPKPAAQQVLQGATLSPRHADLGPHSPQPWHVLATSDSPLNPETLQARGAGNTSQAPTARHGLLRGDTRAAATAEPYLSSACLRAGRTEGRKAFEQLPSRITPWTTRLCHLSARGAQPVLQATAVRPVSLHHRVSRSWGNAFSRKGITNDPPGRA